MKRFAIFIFLSPVLFILLLWLVIMPITSIVAGHAAEFEIRADTTEAIVLGFLFVGLVLGFADWIAGLLVWRPWLTGLIGWGMGMAAMYTWLIITPSSPVWIAGRGFPLAISAVACSSLVMWLETRRRTRKRELR